MNELVEPQLKSAGAIPYGGRFEINLPERGLVGMGTNFEMLLINVKKYRFANGLPVGLGIVEELETEVCRKYPSECEETSALVPRREGKVGWQDVMEGTLQFGMEWLRLKLKGVQLVPSEEADRRARICAACPNNMEVHFPCAGICGPLKKVVESMVGHARTSVDQRLKSCAICLCWNSASVHVPLEVQWPVLTDRQKAQFRFARDHCRCWKCPVEAA